MKPILKVKVDDYSEKHRELADRGFRFAWFDCGDNPDPFENSQFNGWMKPEHIKLVLDSVNNYEPSGNVPSSHIQQILTELSRATIKFPTWPTDPLHALAVLGEEFGELTKEVLQLTYEPHKSSLEDVKKEAIQTAAMAIRFCLSLDQYQYQKGPQHAQDASGV